MRFLLTSMAATGAASQACKFTPTGGEVVVTFSLAPLAAGAASDPQQHQQQELLHHREECYASGGRGHRPGSRLLLLVTVADTGVGISREFHHMLTQPFAQQARSDRHALVVVAPVAPPLGCSSLSRRHTDLVVDPIS